MANRILQRQVQSTANPNLYQVAENVYIYMYQTSIAGNDSAIYFFRVNFPDLYPFISPQVEVITKVYHPNVNLQTGKLHTARLCSKQGQLWTLPKLLQHLQRIIVHPDLQHCCENQAASDYTHDNALYQDMVKEYAHKYAN